MAGWLDPPDGLMAGSASLTPCRFVLSHPLVASAVIGATDVSQLREIIIASEAGPLDKEVLELIDQVHARLPNPTP